MADEILNSGGDQPKPQLSPENRSKLDAIVTKMISNKESDASINAVVNDFKTKYGETKKSASPQTVQQPTAAFKPMTDIMSIPDGGYKPMMPEAVVDDHTRNTMQASGRVVEHVKDIDNSIRNLIYDYKKNLSGQSKSVQLGQNPRETMPANSQVAAAQKMTEQPITVSDQEVQQYKQDMNNDPNMVRTALGQKIKDLSKTNPGEANRLKADIYRLDSDQRTTDKTVEKNVDKINRGDVEYDPVRGILYRPHGFFGSLALGYKQKKQLFDDYEFFTKTTNEDAIIKELNSRMKDRDPDEVVDVPEGPWGEAGAVLGGQPIKPIVGGALAGYFGTPEAGAAAAAGISAHEMYKLGYASSLQSNYFSIKKQHPDMPDYTAYRQAKSLAEKQSVVDAATGAAMGLVGGESALKPTGITTPILEQAVRSSLKEIGEESAKKLMEGVGVGAIGAGGQVIKNLMAESAGLPVSTTEGVGEAGAGGLAMTAGMAILAKSPKLLKPSTYTELVHGLSKAPDNVLNQEFNNLQEVGYISPEELQAAQKAIKEQREVDASIPDNIGTTDRLKIQAKIKERNILEDQLEKADPAYHPDLKERIKALNEEIVSISKGDDKEGLKKLVHKEALAGNIKGGVADMLLDASENELNKHFKDIADWAHNYDSHNEVEETFGKNISSKAKELYPKEVFPSEAGAGKIESAQVGGVEVSEHGEDVKTAEGKENGTHDSELTSDGVKEAKELGKYLFEKKKNWIVSSAVERAKETAQKAAAFARQLGHKVKTEVSNLLNTWNIGEYDGKPEGSFSEEDWIKKSDEAPKDGEGFNSFTSRMEDAYKYIKSLPDDYHVVTHSKVLRALDALKETGGKWNDKTTELFLTNKEKSNAVPERSTTQTTVDETPGSSQEMGSGVSQPGEVAVPQGGQRPSAKVFQGEIPDEENQTESPSKKIGAYPGEMDLPFGEDIGISHFMRQMRAYNLGEEGPVRGEVLTPEQYVRRGRRLINEGVDPEQVAADFKKSGKIGVDDISVVRAENERLARETNKAARQYGIDSRQDKEAKAAESKWYNEVVKPMLTAWGAMGREAQGQTDIDTGTFTGIRRAFEQQTNKEMTPAQKKQATKLSNEVAKRTDDVKNSEAKLTEDIDKAFEKATGKKSKSVKEKAEDLAELLRKGKINRPDRFSAATPASLVWDGAIEVMAKTLEASGSVYEAIASGLSHIRESDWYKNLNGADKGNAENAFKNYFGEDIFTRFANKTDNNFTPEEAKEVWDYAKEAYLNRGAGFDEAVNGVAMDLGLNNNQIRYAIASPKGGRQIVNSVYLKQYHQRQAIQMAKQWVRSANDPWYAKALKFIPNAFFRAKVAWHGTVGGITHAGMNIFIPSRWKAYWPAFFKQFKFAFGGITKAGKANYEKAMQDLVNDPEFAAWKRAGLAIDPAEKYDDYQIMSKIFGSGMGERGFNALKVMRLAMAKGEWNRLSNTERSNPEVVKEIASIINHATGTSKISLPDTVGTLFFAPRLEASRWARLIVQPAKAIGTFANWKKASMADRVAAKIVAKRAGETIGMYVAALAANQGLLAATGSKHHVNFLHPGSPDWLKFKAGDKSIDVSGGMMSAVGFIGHLMRLSVESGRELKGKNRRDELAKTLYQYGRGKLSPFASTATDFITQHDYSGNTMPFSKDKPISKFGHKLDWEEYIFNQQTPIPIAEALKANAEQMRERGMSKEDVNTIMSAIFVGAMSGFTGARITEEPTKHSTQ